MAEEVTSFSGSNKGSNSEVQSLSSYQSDSCDDNGKTHLAHTAQSGMNPQNTLGPVFCIKQGVDLNALI